MRDMNSNHQDRREYHFLLIHYYEMRVIQLESRLTSLGRDPSKDIAIECDLISREHATFLRVPSLDPDKYEYRIIDGGPSKNRSKNGISINGKSSYLHRLEHGDIISFSGAVKGIYLKVDLNPAELKKYTTIIKTVRRINEKTRDKIVLMTRVFDKLTPYLSTDGTKTPAKPSDRDNNLGILNIKQ